jgi:hypothetical protein
MCTAWLRQPNRAPSARFIMVASLERCALRFHKRSIDNSGKADAFSTGRSTDVVWGVVFELDDNDKPALDQAEGLGRGYSERVVELLASDGGRFNSSMYYADANAIDRDLRPYSWYLRLVVNGARQHLLPADYIARLVKLRAWEDSDCDRDRSRRAIIC